MYSQVHNAYNLGKHVLPFNKLNLKKIIMEQWGKEKKIHLFSSKSLKLSRNANAEHKERNNFPNKCMVDSKSCQNYRFPREIVRAGRTLRYQNLQEFMTSHHRWCDCAIFFPKFVSVMCMQHRRNWKWHSLSNVQMSHFVFCFKNLPQRH